MYSAGTSVPIKSSSSLLYNNFDALLSENPLETLYGIVHKSTVWLFNPKAALEGDSTTYKRVICKGEGSHSSSLIFQVSNVLMFAFLIIKTSSFVISANIYTMFCNPLIFFLFTAHC